MLAERESKVLSYLSVAISILLSNHRLQGGELVVLLNCSKENSDHQHGFAV